MKWLTGTAFIAVLLATPVWAGESGGFDPDQPFKGFSQRLLESFLCPAMDAMKDHLEISGKLDTDAPSPMSILQLRAGLVHQRTPLNKNFTSGLRYPSR